MKKLLEIIICLAFVCSIQNNEVAAQSVANQVIKTVNLDPNQQIEDLIRRSIERWSSEGYTVVPYTEFKTHNLLPCEILDRFQENLVRYANRDFGGEHNSFVIYKRGNYSTEYYLQVIEDCAGQCSVPNKFTQADRYSMSD